MANRTINSNYWLGDVVFLRVNEDRKPGMVTRLTICANGAISYAVTWRGGNETFHYDCELTSEYLPDYGTAELQKDAGR